MDNKLKINSNIYVLEFCKRNFWTQTWSEEVNGGRVVNRTDGEKETNISRSPSRSTRSQQYSSTYDVNEANVWMKSNNQTATQAENMNGESRGRSTSVSVECGRERRKSLSPFRYLRSQHTSPTAEINVRTESDDQRAAESSRKDIDTQSQRPEFQLGGKVRDRADAIMQNGGCQHHPLNVNSWRFHHPMGTFLESIGMQLSTQEVTTCEIGLPKNHRSTIKVMGRLNKKKSFMNIDGILKTIATEYS